MTKKLQIILLIIPLLEVSELNLQHLFTNLPAIDLNHFMAVTIRDSCDPRFRSSTRYSRLQLDDLVAETSGTLS